MQSTLSVKRTSKLKGNRLLRGGGRADGVRNLISTGFTRGYWEVWPLTRGSITTPNGVELLYYSKKSHKSKKPLISEWFSEPLAGIVPIADSDLLITLEIVEVIPHLFQDIFLNSDSISLILPSWYGIQYLLLVSYFHMWDKRKESNHLPFW